MAGKLSAGLLLYRIRDDVVQVLIGHMGGPFWAKKDDGGWSIPKGEYTENEDAFTVAQREFEEEIGFPVPAEVFTELGSFRQPSGKVVRVWAAEGDLDPSVSKSNTFEMEWPKGSGKIIVVPEIDRADWFDIADARRKLLKGQLPALEELLSRLRAETPHLKEAHDVSVAGSYDRAPQASLF